MARQCEDLLKSYAEFTSKSDSPQVFHLWIALGTIAGSAQRKIFMHTLYFDVHPNMYIILTSPPGRAKKGAALRTGKNFLRGIEPKINFATESGSPEGLIKLFTKIENPTHQSLSLYSMELGTLMATKPPEMVDMLTDIYDGNPDWARGTIAHNVQSISRPFLNLMAGTTPKWLGDKLGLIALEGGLVARCIFPYSDERILDNAWPEEDPRFNAIGRKIINDLTHIAHIEGEFKFADGRNGEAFKWYEEWYKNHDRFPKLEDPRTISYFDRKHIHMLKVAISLSLSYKDTLELTLEDLQRANKLLTLTEPGMAKALGAAGKNPLATELLRVAAQLASKKQVAYRDLLIANYHDLGKKNLDLILDELKSMGRAKQEGMTYTWIGGNEA